VNYDSKYYEFATTVQPIPGKVEPPPGEKWIFVEMKVTDKAPLQAVAIWAHQKKP